MSVLKYRIYISVIATCIVIIVQIKHFYAPRKISVEQIVATLSVRLSVRPSVSPSVCASYYLKSDFETVLQKWSPCWVDVSRAKFRSLPWSSRSQRDLAAKSCPAHNFVIWSRILKIFHKNDHHIETTCLVQDLSRYLKGQGHNIT